MSVADLSRKGASIDAAEFTCPHYTPLPGGKRCQSYQDGGTCARSDRFLCTEWEKRNRHRLPVIAPRGDEAAVAGSATTTTCQAPASPPPTDLFGNPAPELAPPKDRPRAETSIAQPTPRTGASGEAEDRRPLRGLTTEDIESFKALRVEVCMRSEAFGEVWLVPDYTGGDRKEITPEHAATICRVLEAFPGSQVVSFEKNPKPDKEAGA